jgi:hypothetical protein
LWNLIIVRNPEDGDMFSVTLVGGRATGYKVQEAARGSVVVEILSLNLEGLGFET